jgi:hypothetical protein
MHTYESSQYTIRIQADSFSKQCSQENEEKNRIFFIFTALTELLSTAIYCNPLTGSTFTVPVHTVLTQALQNTALWEVW